MDKSLQKEHINCFVIASGDSDFSPLVSKLKENNKYVIGVGVKNSTSDLLIENCDEFIFYEDLVRGQQRQLPQIANVPEKVQECFALLVDSVLALQRENKEVLWGSMVKETMKRKKPSFNETYYGFRTFSHLLEDAQRRGIVTLRRDQRSGSYIVEDLGAAAGSGTGRPEAVPAPGPRPVEAAPASPAPPAAPAITAAADPGEAANGTRSPRRRRSRGRRARSGAPGAAAAAESGTEAAGAEDDGAEDDSPYDSAESAPFGPAEDDRAGSDAASFTEPAPAPREMTTAAPPPEPAPRAAEPERSSFSLFSWIRREPREHEEERGGKPERQD
jgi:hypothetical protein